MRYLIYCSLLVTVLNATAQPVVMDRLAIIVGRRAVKWSDLDRDLRASQLLNRQPLNVGDAARRQIAERLIDQEMIRQETRNGNYSQPDAAAVDNFVARLVKDRFGASQNRFQASLKEYGLNPEQFREYVRFQLMVLRFIDERFRPGVLVTEEDVTDYYNKNKTELARANPRNNSREALEETIRNTIAAERVNQAFEEWLKQVRRQTRVEYRPAAFGGELPPAAAAAKLGVTQ